MRATRNSSLTLTCNIGDATLNKAVHVSWKDEDDAAIEDGEDGCNVTQGSVGEDKVQESTLSITTESLKHLNTEFPVTWKCAARSTQFPNSEQSPFQDVVVTFYDLG